MARKWKKRYRKVRNNFRNDVIKSKKKRREDEFKKRFF